MSESDDVINLRRVTLHMGEYMIGRANFEITKLAPSSAPRWVNCAGKIEEEKHEHEGKQKEL